MNQVAENIEINLFEKYDKIINDLYKFRDEYYIINVNCKNADERNKSLLNKLEDLSHHLETINNDQFESKKALLIGKAYNVLPDFNLKACEYLTKAIKLDPKSIEAWNYLGECYWKKRDFEMCRNCFERSLNISRRNKRA